MTTISIFKFDNHKFWAFKQMRLALSELSKVKGLKFYKVLGCGSGNGFGILPDLGTYVLLLVWENEEIANRFFEENILYLVYCQKSVARQTIYMDAIGGHGLWDGQNPFDYVNLPDHKSPLIVITRARIRFFKLLNFWKFVPKVSKSMENAPGLVFGLGIGELPLIQQATFSLWKDHKSMMNYAYTKASHKEVVSQTRKQDWYKEEMFARFAPYKSVGNIEMLSLPIN